MLNTYYGTFGNVGSAAWCLVPDASTLLTLPCTALLGHEARKIMSDTDDCLGAASPSEGGEGEFISCGRASTSAPAWILQFSWTNYAVPVRSSSSDRSPATRKPFHLPASTAPFADTVALHPPFASRAHLSDPQGAVDQGSHPLSRGDRLTSVYIESCRLSPRWPRAP